MFFFEGDDDETAAAVDAAAADDEEDPVAGAAEGGKTAPCEPFIDTSLFLNCERPGLDDSLKRTGVIQPVYLSASIRRGPL